MIPLNPLSTLLLLALVLLMGSPAQAREYRVKVIKVIDGDTVITDRTAFGFPLKARLAGVDAPESSLAEAKCPLEIERGKAATAFAADLYKRGGMRATLKRPQRDSYNSRYVFDIYITADGKRIEMKAALLSAGHVKRYEPIKDHDFTKPDWCTPDEEALP
jgi:endonuclease YncB( thermonuclease family)